MTLLSIVQNVARVANFDVPVSVIGSSHETASQMLALSNKGGQIMANRGSHGWSVLQREHEFSTTATVAEYALPDDYRALISETLWDRTNFWELRGPLNPQEWQLYKSGIVVTGPRRRVRIRRSATSNLRAIWIDPTPETTGDDLIFEYLSTSWCQSSGGTPQTAWAADDDTGILDESLLELDLTWRFKKEQGLEWRDDQKEFEWELQQALAQDGGMPVLNMSGPTDQQFLEVEHFPDGNWPT